MQVPALSAVGALRQPMMKPRFSSSVAASAPRAVLGAAGVRRSARERARSARPRRGALDVERRRCPTGGPTRSGGARRRREAAPTGRSKTTILQRPAAWSRLSRRPPAPPTRTRPTRASDPDVEPPHRNAYGAEGLAPVLCRREAQRLRHRRVGAPRAITPTLTSPRTRARGPPGFGSRSAGAPGRSLGIHHGRRRDQSGEERNRRNVKLMMNRGREADTTRT